MRKPPVNRDDETLGLNDSSVTRRDFVGGAILGTGAALLGMAAPGLLRAAEPAYRNPAYKRGSMRHLGVRGGTRTLIGRA